MLKSEVIKLFLERFAHHDLAARYSLAMECQVNVAQDHGTRVEGEFKGRKWNAWTDGISTWKSFRIPFKAATEPEYEDSEIKYDFVARVEAIGMTGWDWMNKLSRWVAYDFDAMVGHSDKHARKLDDSEIKKLVEVVKQVEWVTIRKSASGKGIHLYVDIGDPIHTENHHEHAALARAILGKMSALCGFDFKAKVDICGGNMWVWHRKQKGTDGFAVVEMGVPLYDVPINWKDHVAVVSGRRPRTKPEFVAENSLDAFEELSGTNTRVPLDESHKALITYLTGKGDSVWWWDADRHMLVTHTIFLKEAHTDLGLKGCFDTLAKGSERGSDQNCYCFPLRKGAWTVRRFSPGCMEHISWTQDQAGWTKCYLNKDPDLSTAARNFGGVELPAGGYQFREAESAVKAAMKLGADIVLAPQYLFREAVIKPHKDGGRLIFELTSDKNDPPKSMEGWAEQGTSWKRIFNMTNSIRNEIEMNNCDDFLRHVVSDMDRRDAGWVIHAQEQWQEEPMENIRPMLKSMGYKAADSEPLIGGCVVKAWRLVNKPFQPEYPGDREWNLKAPQLRFVPTSETDVLKYPTWMKILRRCGSGLDEAIKNNGWALANGIANGGDYLKCWVASLFQFPGEPLPYLFFYGPQNCGKSIFYESLNLLMTTGCVKSDGALTNSNGFNGELQNAVLCYIEETDLSKSAHAYNRIKDYVTSRTISIHVKKVTPYQMPNTTHWVQCSNDQAACPVFNDDTRITVCRVEALDEMERIAKKKLFTMLETEASDFLAALLGLEIPEISDRLNVPVITTTEKMNLQAGNTNHLVGFVKESCHKWNGKMITFAAFYERFQAWLPAEERHNWTKHRVSKECPSEYPKGKYTDNIVMIGNMSFEQMPADAAIEKPWLLSAREYLVRQN